MAKCTSCNKNASRTRIVTNGICNVCSSANASVDVNYDDAPCDPNEKIGDTSVKDFVDWMCRALVKCIKEPLSLQLAECTKDLKQAKEEVKNLKASLAKANGEIAKLKEDVKTINDERDKERKTVRDHCKYLINHDRSVRQGLRDDPADRLLVFLCCTSV